MTISSRLVTEMKERSDKSWFCGHDFEDPNWASCELWRLWKADKLVRRKYTGSVKKVRWEYRPKTQFELGTLSPNVEEPEAIKPAVAVEVAPPAPEPPVLDPMADVVASFVSAFERIVDRRVELALTRLAAALSDAAPTLGEQTAEVLSRTMGKKTKPRVLIVGLLGGSFDQLLKTYGDDIDLRIYYVDDPIEQLVAKARNADRVVLMTKFISHRHQDAVRDHPGLTYVNGGVSQLEERLMELVA